MILNLTNQVPEQAALIILGTPSTDDSIKAGPAQYAGMGLKEYAYRLFYNSEGRLCFLLHIPSGHSNYGKTLEAARLLAHENKDQWPDELVLDSQLDAIDHPMLLAAVEGLSLGQYQIGKWKSEAAEHKTDTVLTVLYLGESLQSALEAHKDEIHTPTFEDFSIKLERTIVLADVEKKIMDLVNAPANHKRPQHLAEWARKSAETYQYRSEIFDKEACIDIGLHALLAVNRGSEDGAQFIVLEYRHPDASEGPVALVGKGVTFDTGGISLKRPTNMHLMKSDMGGAAAVLATLEAAARMQLPLHLVGIVPTTDNSVDALSIKPSDVIQSYSGKTIEIIDTDAEGRLILSDGLAYAIKHFQPRQLISIATLTGSAVRTFGYECAALFSKNEEMVSDLRQTGERVGQRCWPLPPWDEYRADLNSDVADIANLNTRPIAGAIDAFKFLEFFTEEHPSYAHLDIAGVALKAGPYARDRQSTAFGPRLLLEWLQQ
ncbi:MAG: leucyl aminopeptidase family protein [Bacteroidota bacterium]